jgi:hypothetical protein
MASSNWAIAPSTWRKDCRWCVVDEGAGAVGRNESDPALAQPGKADFLHHQVASKALAVSTMIVLTPLPSIVSSMAENPGHASMASAPLTAAS